MLKAISLCAALLTGAMTVSAVPLTVFAEEEAAPTSGKCGENLTWEFDEATGTLTFSGTGVLDNIDNNHDWNCWEKECTKVIIQEGITELDSKQWDYSSWEALFGSFTALKEVKLPSTLKKIGAEVFAYCTALETIEIPDSVTSLGFGAFYSSGLKSISLPDSVTEIPDYLFFECTDLAEIRFPAKMTKIGMNAFSETAWYSSSVQESQFVIVNDWLVAVNQEQCVGKVTVPGTAKNIAAGMFGYIFIDWDHLSGYDGAEGVTGPTEVVFSEGVESIGTQMFFGCTTLKSVEFPSTLKKIEAGEADDISGGGMFKNNGMWRVSDVVVTIKSTDCEIEDAAHTLGCSGWDDLNKSYTIRGYDGSTAEAYAREWGFTFESLGEAPAKEAETGDLDGDGEIGVTDAQLVLTAYVKGMTGGDTGLTAEQVTAADVDNDGEITITDAQLILNYYVQNTILGANVGWDTLMQ